MKNYSNISKRHRHFYWKKLMEKGSIPFQFYYFPHLREHESCKTRKNKNGNREKRSRSEDSFIFHRNFSFWHFQFDFTQFFFFLSNINDNRGILWCCGWGHISVWNLKIWRLFKSYGIFEFLFTYYHKRCSNLYH